MHLTLRPSKTFLFENLARELGKIRGGQGLDAACAAMKNRWMFRTDTYVGLDFDQDALDAGLRRAAGDPRAHAFKADLTKPVPLPSGAFRAVVTTNTLSHLDASGRATALDELTRLTAPDGVFLCELPMDDGTAGRTLETSFQDVKATYFKNAYSRAYERLFERDGWLGTHRIAGSPPFLLLAWLVSRLEYLTCRAPAGNSHVLYQCSRKRA